MSKCQDLTILHPLSLRANFRADRARTRNERPVEHCGPGSHVRSRHGEGHTHGGRVERVRQRRGVACCARGRRGRAYLAVNVRPSASPAVRERELAALTKLPSGKFNRREQMPARFRFRAHRRIPDVLVLGDEGTCYWVSLEYILRNIDHKITYEYPYMERRRH